MLTQNSDCATPKHRNHRNGKKRLESAKSLGETEVFSRRHYYLQPKHQQNIERFVPSSTLVLQSPAVLGSSPDQVNNLRNATGEYGLDQCKCVRQEYSNITNTRHTDIEGMFARTLRRFLPLNNYKYRYQNIFIFYVNWTEINKGRPVSKKRFCLNKTSYKIHLNGFFTIMSNSFKNYFSKKSQADLRIYFSGLYVHFTIQVCRNTFQLKMNHLNKWFILEIICIEEILS